MNIKIRESDSWSVMNIKLFLVVLLFIIRLPAHMCNNYLCDNSVNLTGASATSRSLVLNSLVQNTSQTGFNTSVYGQSPQQIYGLLQCRGDTTVDQCYNCSQEANATIRQVCGNSVGGKIWFDFCFLRYANYNFFGEQDLDYYYDYQPNNVSNPDAFNADLDSLITNLSAEAVNISTRNRYASGTTVNFYPKIYGLVQCIRDVSSENCSICISTATTALKATYYGCSGVKYMLGSCIVIYEINPFFNSASPVEAPTTMPTAGSKRSKKIPLILGSVFGSLLPVLLVCLFRTRRRLKSAMFRRGYEVNKRVEEDTLDIEDRHIVTFKMETLVAATKNFHDNNKLGKGGFGAVYKGINQDGLEIAVKRLSLNSVQGKKEFLNEVKVVAKIQHRNLVKLLGFCAEGLERLLVYEYLPNNSLDKFLFDPIKRKQIDWHKRYNIIMGVARGLLYLHHDSQPRIIHRDIKASNILLDDKLNPKIADFGLAKLFPEDESYVSTRVAGTFGYMAPEYALQGQLTVKADVYSFGVLLLELVTGRKNTDYNLSPEMQILLRWAWTAYELGIMEQIIDPVALNETCDEGQALRCIHVGLLCTQAEASLRPPMSTATLMLSSDSAMLPDPTKPVFVSSNNQNTRSSGSGSGLSHSNGRSSSASHLTPITDLVPR